VKSNESAGARAERNHSNGQRPRLRDAFRGGKALYFPKGILPKAPKLKKKLIVLMRPSAWPLKKPNDVSSFRDGDDSGWSLRIVTYAPSFGIMPLRKTWKEMLLEKNPSPPESKSACRWSRML
jgi:hypothetical protein